MSGISTEKGKVSKEIATSDVEKWLDFKNIKPEKRERFKGTIESMVLSVMDGSLVLKEEDMNWVHPLSFPVGAEKAVKELRFKPRLTAGDMKMNCTGAYADGDGRIIGIIAALTGLPKNVVENLDTEDYNIAGGITLFFI